MAERQPEVVRVAAGALLAALIVVALYIGRPVLVPLVIAVFFTLVLVRAADRLGTLPLLRGLHAIVRQFLVLAVMGGIGILLGILITDILDRIALQLPVYEANIEALINTTAARFGLDHIEVWPEVYRGLQDTVDLRSLGLFMLTAGTSLVAAVSLIAVYSGFLLVERGQLARKLAHAIGDEARAERARVLILRISDSMSDYLATKTLVNVILAVPSYAILHAFGVDFALFWAVLIGLVNYIPYLGSVLGVFFPSVLSLGQFGSIGYTLALAAALTVPQLVVGNVIDPWMMGRRVNLSPLVVIMSLVVWASLWGLPGAILAVPLTAAVGARLRRVPGPAAGGDHAVVGRRGGGGARREARGAAIGSAVRGSPDARFRARPIARGDALGRRLVRFCLGGPESRPCVRRTRPALLALTSRATARGEPTSRGGTHAAEPDARSRHRPDPRALAADAERLPRPHGARRRGGAAPRAPDLRQPGPCLCGDGATRRLWPRGGRRTSASSPPTTTCCRRISPTSGFPT